MQSQDLEFFKVVILTNTFVSDNVNNNGDTEDNVDESCDSGDIS